MDLLHAALLGLIQGATEVLPISSSGHLILIPRLLGWPDSGLTFDVALHFGTFLAIFFTSARM
jgi:undecaprenyl-diphosphatase